jgi:predicted nucleic acid-binding protein
MVLVDTSIWITLYRQQRSTIGQRLWMLAARNEAAVSGQIWVELLGGFRKTAERSVYTEKLRSYVFLDTTRDAYDLAAELLAKHTRLGAGDAIIAATAITSHAALFTIDRDFDTLTAHGLQLFV